MEPALSLMPMMETPVQPDEGEALRLVTECSGREDAHLYAIRAEAYTEILAAHSLQHFSYSFSLGRMVDTREWLGERNSEVFNIILPALEGFMSLLLAKEPRRSAHGTTRDEGDIESAHYVTGLLDWAADHHGAENLAHQAANWLAKTGNVIFFVGWDPAGGRQIPLSDGSSLFEGDPILRVDSMFAWNFHPHAKNYMESPYAHHATLVSRDWLREHYPEKEKEIADIPDMSESAGLVFERGLLNLSTQGSGLGTSLVGRAPEGESFVELHTVYIRSSPQLPQGRMIVAVGSSDAPRVLLFDGPNPYIEHKTGKRTLPVVHMKDLDVPGRLWGEGRTLHMLPMQRYINESRAQIRENAEMCANPIMIYPSSGVDPNAVTNDIGLMLPYAVGSTPPAWLYPPPLPDYLKDAEAAALQYADIFMAPVGPSSAEADANIKSGVHEMIVQEQKRARVAPTIRAWEMAWESVWRLYVDNWRSFATLPREIEVHGADGLWRKEYFSGSMASKSVMVKVVPYSAMPTSRTASFAEWIEISKSPLGATLDDGQLRRMWTDIDKGDMARSYRDNTVHTTKAYRNIQRVRKGELRLAEIQDNADAHLAVYTNWMATGEFELLIATDPTLAQRMSLLVESFMNVKQAQLIAAQGLPPEGENIEAQKVEGSASAPQTGGDGGYPRRTQGFGNSPGIPKPAGRPS